MKSPLCFLLSLFVSSALIADENPLSPDRITSGGGEISLGASVPGVLQIETPAVAFLEDNQAHVVAAAGKVGKGKVIAFSHGGFLIGADLAAQKPHLDLIKNAIVWTTNNDKNPRIGVHPDTSRAIPMLEKLGLKAEIIPAESVRKSKVDVYLVKGESAQALADQGIANLQEYLQDGGSIIIASTPWPFPKDFPDFSQFPGNRLLKGSGIQFDPNGYASSKAPLVLNQGSNESPLIAVTRLTAEHKKLPASEQASLLADLKKGPFLRGEMLDQFLIALKRLNETVGPIIPTKESPVVPGNSPLVDAIIEVETTLNLRLPAGKMYAIPASSDYPGAVDPGAKRETKNLTIRGIYKGWATGRGAGGWQAGEMRPTGLYAAPGEMIEVTVPDAAAGKGFEVVIGTYNGGLDNRDKWARYPKLQRSFPVLSTTTKASNGLGGLVTIRVPRGAAIPEIKVTITGAIGAPLYVHGVTSSSDWKKNRNSPAPWAELASERIIIAIPSDHIRQLDDPDKVMEVWNAYLNTAAKLAVLDRENYRAERIVFDRQTAAGHMHSGYPVAAHIGPDSKQAVDSKSLAHDGSWGFFHEYGHNHQHDLWALPNTVETTCNLWSVYIFEELIGKNRNETHDAIRPLTRKTRVNKYFADGANFESTWSMWNALDTYLLIQEEFGWEPFQKIFAEYNALPKEEWPKSQQEKNDQLVIRLSKACGKNLAPFWKKWNLPLTEKVDAELSGLEVWECKDLPTS